MIHDYLPISREDMEKRNWEQCDFVYVTGDAYVDHPSFGHAIISRILESHGYKVGIIAQPDWKNADSVRILGERIQSLGAEGQEQSKKLCLYVLNRFYIEPYGGMEHFYDRFYERFAEAQTLVRN